VPAACSPLLCGGGYCGGGGMEYEITKKGLQINDTFTDMYNPIFDALIKYYIH
jgi:hypothetical protein